MDMQNVVKASLGYMIFSAIVGIVLGLIMIFYPGGTMALMTVAFGAFQIILTIFILYYALSEAIYYFKNKRPWNALGFLVLGALGTLFVWIFSVGVIYWFVAFFLILSGIGEFIGAFQTFGGNFFVALLGILNVIVGILIVSNPVILPLIIAWYVFFWGFSRLFLALELRKLATR